MLIFEAEQNVNCNFGFFVLLILFSSLPFFLLFLFKIIIIIMPSLRKEDVLKFS